MIGSSTAKSIRPVKLPLLKSKAGRASPTRGRKMDAASAASIFVFKIFPNSSSLELMPGLIRPLAENIVTLKCATTAIDADLAHRERRCEQNYTAMSIGRMLTQAPLFVGDVIALIAHALR